MQKDGGYWDSNTGNDGQGFACYIKDKLPYASDYLAGHADCAVALVMDKSGETEVLKAYPQGEERRAINAVFDEIVADLKLQHTLTHAETTLPLAVQAVPLAENEQITIFTMERPSVIGQLAAARSAEKSTPAQAAPQSPTRRRFKEVKHWKKTRIIRFTGLTI
ncbi:MAG: LPD1 domain-containing protein [Eubacteriales bacterium]